MKSNLKDSVTIKRKTGCGDVYVTCQYSKGHLKYVSMHMGKKGSCASATTQTLQDALNVILRLGGNVNNIIEGIEGHQCYRGDCCSNAIADALKEWDEHYGAIPK